MKRENALTQLKNWINVLVVSLVVLFLLPHYNANGNQDASWYYWDNPDVSGSDKWVSTIIKYDAQNRQIKTFRIVQNAVNVSTPPDIDNYLLGGYSAATDVVALTSTTYNSVGKVDSVEGEYRIKENGSAITERGTLTGYDYDETGNIVETRSYSPSDTLLTTTRSLYDKEGKVLVTVGPYAAGLIYSRISFCCRMQRKSEI